MSRDDIHEAGASGAVAAFGGLPKLLQLVYPQHPWDLARFRAKNKAATQRLLLNFVRELFPGAGSYSILAPATAATGLSHFGPFSFRRFRTVAQEVARLALSNSSEGKHVEVDVLISDLRLAIEYQGEQHYSDVRRVGQQREHADVDEMKALACASNGITLVEVPYSWDLTSVRRPFPSRSLRAVLETD